MTDSHPLSNSRSCLGSTCLKWGADGELTALDLNLVLERLALVDQELTPVPQEHHDRSHVP